MVRMDAPRASLSREMCAFLKGVGCIVVSSLAVYLLLSGLSTTGARWWAICARRLRRRDVGD